MSERPYPFASTDLVCPQPIHSISPGDHQVPRENMRISVEIGVSGTFPDYLELRVSLRYEGQVFHFLETLERDHMMSAYDRIMQEATARLKEMAQRHITGQPPH